MSYPYSPQDWANGAAGNTPLNDTRHDYMEAGIKAVSDHVQTLDTGKENTGVAHTEATNAVTAHVAAADPHTQYYNAARAGNAVTKNVGTVAGTVAAGDDSRITGALQAASNLSDLASASAARTALGLSTAATLPVGTATNTLAAGDDSRITAAASKPDLVSTSGAPPAVGTGANGVATTAARSDHTHGGLPATNPVVSGTLTLSADPSSALQAATKQYVDNHALSLAASVAARPASPVQGTMIYRTDKNFVEVYDGGAWRVQGTVLCSALTDITNPVDGQRAYLTTDAVMYRYRASDTTWYSTAPKTFLTTSLSSSTITAGNSGTLASLTITDPGWSYRVAITAQVGFSNTSNVGYLVMSAQDNTATWNSNVIAKGIGYAQAPNVKVSGIIAARTDNTVRSGSRTIYLVAQSNQGDTNSWSNQEQAFQVTVNPA